jgi:hypothetical protein
MNEIILSWCVSQASMSKATDLIKRTEKFAIIQCQSARNSVMSDAWTSMHTQTQNTPSHLTAFGAHAVSALSARKSHTGLNVVETVLVPMQCMLQLSAYSSHELFSYNGNFSSQ